jgi:hypothetical protein
MGFSLLASLAICIGVDVETRKASDIAAPLLGIFVGAWAVSRNGHLKTGLFIGLAYVVPWFVFWMYLMARWNLVEWVTVGVPRIRIEHIVWWGTALLAALAGSYLRRKNRRLFFGAVAAGVFIWTGSAAFISYRCANLPSVPGLLVERDKDFSDGTISYLLTLDLKRIDPKVMIYDCDYDYGLPTHTSDSNTVFLGLNLTTMVATLNDRMEDKHVLFAINGGFFGASGWSVAHHEEPMNLGGEVRYDVDLIHPKDQAWFFAINPPVRVSEGQPRFVMAPTIPWNELGGYETVLGGVRPLRVDGRSLPLLPANSPARFNAA